MYIYIITVLSGLQSTAAVGMVVALGAQVLVVVMAYAEGTPMPVSFIKRAGVWLCIATVLMIIIPVKSEMYLILGVHSLDKISKDVRIPDRLQKYLDKYLPLEGVNEEE